MKKLLYFLLAFGFMCTPVWAQYDEEDEEYEEEEAPKAVKKASTAKKSQSAGNSRIGLAVNFVGDQPNLGFVYDMGSSIEIYIGLGLSRTAYAEFGGNIPDPAQYITGILGLSYSLGKGLLDYGLGANLEILSKSREELTDINGFVFFYTKADLLQNVSLKLSAGANVYMPGQPDSIQNQNTIANKIDLVTSAGVIFYFM